MRRRLTRLGLLGLAVAVVSAMSVSPAAAKTKTATFNQCVPVFAVIPDFPATGPAPGASVSIPVTVPKNRGKAQDGQVTAFSTTGIYLPHTFMSDIVLNLVSPGGKAVTLANQVGGNDDGFGSTGCPSGLLLFGDAFTTPIAAAANPASSVLPVTGAFKPEGLLSTFVGGPARGNWTFVANDLFNTDTGTIGAVSLNFTYTYNATKKKKKKK